MWHARGVTIKFFGSHISSRVCLSAGISRAACGRVCGLRAAHLGGIVLSCCLDTITVAGQSRICTGFPRLSGAVWRSIMLLMLLQQIVVIPGAQIKVTFFT